MKLMDILNELKYDISKSNMRSFFEECMKLYFPEHYKSVKNDEWEYPTFEVTSHKKNAGWFLCNFKKNIVVNPVIGVNKDFVEHTLKNIVFHETIHYVQANTYGQSKYSMAANGAHDSFFKETMARINSKEGNDFITVTQDTTNLDVISGGKEFWVYGLQTHKGEFAFAWSGRENEKVRKHLLTQKSVNLYKNVYEFKSNKFKYKIGSITAKSFKMAIPNEQPTQEEMSKYEIK